MGSQASNATSLPSEEGDKTTEAASPASTAEDKPLDAAGNTHLAVETQPAEAGAETELSSSTSSESASSETEAETDSPLDNAKFLSFEEWKKQNLEKIGQSPENVGQGRASADGRKRPSPINNALDTLGEEGEIELEFGFGSGRGGEPSSRWPPSQPQESATVEEAPSEEPTTSGSKSNRKDAGTTCNERFNYASFDCAATILKTNPQCKSSSSILVENKDSYMLNECAADNKFIIVELCDDILIDTIVLANFEFFSSMFRTFRVSISDRYPVKMDRWKELGIFEARNSREIQAFAVENPLIWARYLRIEFLTHYGNEYYCPVSLLRVHGTTMMEEFRSQEEPGRSDDEVEAEENEPVEEISTETPPEGSPTAEPMPIEEPKAATTEASGVPEMKYEQGLPVMVGNISDLLPTPSDIGSAQDDIPGPSSAPNTSSGVVDIRHSHRSGNESISTDSVGSTGTNAAADIVGSNSTASITSTGTTTSSLRLPTSSSMNSTSNDTALTTDIPSAHNITLSNNTVSSDNGTTSKPTQASQDASKTQSSTQASAASPTTQESFFKSIHKRLQMLEANSTLSLQYIEEQSRILRDAFTKVQKRQMAKAEAFLENLNTTVLTELQGFRQQYDQLWQSTVIELETNREQYQREMSALSTRLTVMADELVFQKRMAVVQSTLLLLCLGLVLFVRSGSSSLELPLMQQVMSKSHSMLRLPFDSPPGSPSSRDTSPPTKGRRFFASISNGRDSDSVGSPSPPPPSGRGKPVIELAPATPSDGDEDEDSIVDLGEPGDGVDAPRVVRQTKSGPATPSGSRENQNPMEWDDGGSVDEGESPSPSLLNGERPAVTTRRTSPLRQAETLDSDGSDVEGRGEAAVS